MRTLKPSPGKFEGNYSQMVARAAYVASMDGCASMVGDCSELGWCASRVEGKRYVFIVIEDDMGFVNADYWRIGDPDADKEWSRLVALEDETREPMPEPEDFAMTPTGPLGSLTAVSQVEGEFHGTFESDEDARAYIKAWMDENKFWPNVWCVSDHGNWTLEES